MKSDCFNVSFFSPVHVRCTCRGFVKSVQITELVLKVIHLKFGGCTFVTESERCYKKIALWEVQDPGVLEFDPY